MEKEPGKKNFPVWVFLIPLFILAAWPALRLMRKANSVDVELSKEVSSAFNSQEGEIRKAAPPAAGTPEFNDGVLGVRYRSKAKAAVDEKPAAEERAEAPAPEKQNRSGRPDAGQSEEDPVKARELQSIGFIKGYLTSSIGRGLNNPKAVGALFNNKNVIGGFMARDTIKAATASPKGLANYLKSGAAANFINNPILKAAMNNPAIVSAIASSGLVSTLLNTPAARTLMNDPKALGDFMNSNPELVSMAMANPNIMGMLSNNPEVAGITKKFGTHNP